jgi:UDP:flavonoid glycosyltransferase YjiC (YdhE family)
MSTVGFAWELGANYGHLARSLPIAQCLRARGHKTMFAVRDVEVAHALLTPAKIGFIGAPCLTRPAASVTSPVNYSQMLLGAGYAQPTTLSALLCAWIHLWQSIEPDCVVIDHSPTALLAARALDIPAVLLGTGLKLLTDRKYKDAAMAFARKYSSFDSERAIDHAADVIEATMGRTG